MIQILILETDVFNSTELIIFNHTIKHSQYVSSRLIQANCLLVVVKIRIKFHAYEVIDNVLISIPYTMRS